MNKTDKGGAAMRQIDNMTDTEREVLALKGMTADNKAKRNDPNVNWAMYNPDKVSGEPYPYTDEQREALKRGNATAKRLATAVRTETGKAQHSPLLEGSIAKGDCDLHLPECSSLPNSKASKILGQCYCDCGAEDKQWRLWEEIDGSTSIYPVGIDPDDLAFGRAKPLCIIPEGKFHVAKLIVASVNHADKLAEALKRLAMLVLQSDFYAESKDETDNALAEVAAYEAAQ